MSEQPSILSKLMEVIEDRKANRPTNSYTVQLLNGGVEAIGTKIREESGEVIEAARMAPKGSTSPLVHEAADLIYHLWVLLACCDIELAQVEAELARRFGTSGLAEKAARHGQ